jgi:hypothetical protein
MTGQQLSLAAASSFHPDPKLKRDPRYQRNNTLNIRSVQHEQPTYGTPYGDAQVVHQGTNLTITGAAQQQIILPGRSMPGGSNPVIPGHPHQIGRREDLERLGTLAGGTTAAMGGSEQRPLGDGRDAINRGLFNPIETRPSTKASGFNTRSVGAMRPMVS